MKLKAFLRVNSYTNAIILLVFISLASFSFIDQKNEEIVKEKKSAIPVNFYIMKITKETLLNYFDKPDGTNKKFKRLIIQFRAISNSGGTDVEYKMKGYVFKTSGTFAGDQPTIDDYDPVKTVPIETPFALTNVECRQPKMKKFFNELGSHINDFDYLKLEPHLDVNGNIAITATAMHEGDKPLEKAKDKVFEIEFNPCPPDIPEG